MPKKSSNAPKSTPSSAAGSGFEDRMTPSRRQSARGGSADLLKEGGRPIGPFFHPTPSPFRPCGGPIGPAFGGRPDLTNASAYGAPFFLRPPVVSGRFGMGYLPDVPDRRDCSFHHIMQDYAEKKLKGVDAEYLKQAIALSANPPAPGQAPRAEIDLRDCHNLTPIEDQGSIGSCTAQAVIGLAEYLIRAGTYETTDLSRMFVYKATRNLMGVTGDTGAYIRTAIKALAAFGAPPESSWPYAAELLDFEPYAYQYAYAANFKAMRYARLDTYTSTPEKTFALLKQVLSAKLPVAFGFPVYESIALADEEPYVIPFPKDNEQLLGGHAVLAVGYKEVDGQECLIIRNSWGTAWGDKGYGYLPVTYVTEGLAVDFWTIFSSSWLVESDFQ